MLKRNKIKLLKAGETGGGCSKRGPAGEPRRPRRRFIILGKAAGVGTSQPEQISNGVPRSNSASQAKAAYASSRETPVAGPPPQAADVAEIIKTLVQLAREQGRLTYDDINEILPDGLTPADLDAIYIKLRELDIEIVEHFEVEKAKVTEPEVEPESDGRLDILDDPIKMYMKEM